jgi:hypothetical protein
LGHEENDMMRPMIIAVPPETPDTLVAIDDGLGHALLTWNDNSLNATSFTVQRATDPAFTMNLTTFTGVRTPGIPQTYTDTTVVALTLYYYRVLENVDLAGISGVPSEPSMIATSQPSNVVKFPSNLYTLTIISPHGIVGKVLDQASYASLDSVILTATADAGWTFTNWTGDVPTPPNAANPVTVTFGTADLTVTANYTAASPTISGNAGVAGATINYTGGSTVADGSGNYSFTVPSSWTGTVTPFLIGYGFSPASKSYTNLVTNMANQNFTATLITYTISGNTTVGGVTLSWTDGTLKMINSNSLGNYSITVPYNWSGTVTPVKNGFIFVPTNITYTAVAANMTLQNYTIIPGSFNKTSPANGATNQPTNPSLTWGASLTTASYDYCIDTVNDNACTAPAVWTTNGVNTSVTLSGLIPGTYYWQVRANNATGTAYANGSATAWFSFTILPIPGAFVKISPVNAAINQPANPTLSWGASSNATKYYYCISTILSCSAPASWISTGANTSVILSGLAPGVRYYWQVIATNATGSAYGNGASAAWWTFTVIQLPGAFNHSSPANGATNQPTNPMLSWGASARVATYDYCINTIASCVSPAAWISTGASTSIGLSGLTPGTYYWQVRANNGAGTTYANGSITAWWSFTILPMPGVFNKVTPTNGIGNRPTSLSLTWGASTSATYYQYCIDTTNDNACTTPAVWTNRTTTSVTVSGLTPGATYYWQVRARNNTGMTYADGSSTAWWSFTVLPLPGTFGKISPANGATGIPTNPTLSWGASTNATSYGYCINTTGATCAAWTSTGLNTSVNLTGLLHGTTYYWQVRARNGVGTTYADGVITAMWTFTVP